MFLDGLPGLEALVERRLEEAAANGELSRLPGEGRPLELDDDRMVPVELRIAHRILKNAGCVPAELGPIAEVRQLIDAAERALDETRGRRLRALLVQIEASGRQATAAQAWKDYEAALQRRLDRVGRP